jgi:hypothetical protein
MEKSILTKQLTIKEQNEILDTLFGFELVGETYPCDKEKHYVLYDEEGEEFYGSSENCQFNFSTLAGIFSYTAHRAKEQGYQDCQFAMRKVLGL